MDWLPLVWDILDHPHRNALVPIVYKQIDRNSPQSEDSSSWFQFEEAILGATNMTQICNPDVTWSTRNGCWYPRPKHSSGCLHTFRKTWRLIQFATRIQLHSNLRLASSTGPQMQGILAGVLYKGGIKRSSRCPAARIDARSRTAIGRHILPDRFLNTDIREAEWL